MEIVRFLASGLTFLTVGFFLMFAYFHLEERYWRKILAQRLLGKTQDAARMEKRRLKQWRRTVASLGGAVMPKQEAKTAGIATALMHAGFRSPEASAVYWGLRLILAAAFGVVYLIVILVSGSATPDNLVMIFFPLAFGYALPALYLRIKCRSRQHEIFRELPDALDLVMICLEAGLGFDRALHRASRELATVSPVLSREFTQYFIEIQSGLPRRAALQKLDQRNGVKPLSSVVSVLLQSAKLGTDIAHALGTYIQTMRTERRLMAEEKGGKVSTRLVFPLVLCILPALFIIILSPAIINIVQTLNR